MPKCKNRPEVGEVVILPCGALAIVNGWDILCGGNVMEVTVYPFTNWLHRFWLFITGQTRFYDAQIDRLRRVPSTR